MAIKGEAFTFTAKGIGWGTVAGTLGAIGAFCLTMAMVSGGGKTPHLVMSYVFPGAVTVAALVGLWQTWGKTETKPELWLGFVLILIGVFFITINTPHAAPTKAPAIQANPHKQ